MRVIVIAALLALLLAAPAEGRKRPRGAVLVESYTCYAPAGFRWMWLHANNPIIPGDSLIVTEGGTGRSVFMLSNGGQITYDNCSAAPPADPVRNAWEMTTTLLPIECLATGGEVTISVIRGANLRLVVQVGRAGLFQGVMNLAGTDTLRVGLNSNMCPSPPPSSFSFQSVASPRLNLDWARVVRGTA